MTNTYHTWPWPFPYWNGERFIMPAELLTKEQRKEFFKKESRTPDLTEYEEALL